MKCKPRGRPWRPGTSGNPQGRPKGALNKLSLAVRGRPLAVSGQAEHEQQPLKCDFQRPHAHTMTQIAGKWRRTVEQDGRVFDRDSGALIDIGSTTPP